MKEMGFEKIVLGHENVCCQQSMDRDINEDI